MAWACIRSGISRSKSRLQRYEDASRPLSGIEIRFASKPSYREFFFTTAWTANYLQQFRFLLFRKKRKKKRRDLNLWRRSMISLGGKCGVENFQNDFLISYSKVESDLESFIVFVKLVSINREREINFSIKTTTRLNLIFLYPNFIVIRTTDVLFSNKYIRD